MEALELIVEAVFLPLMREIVTFFPESVLEKLHAMEVVFPLLSFSPPFGRVIVIAIGTGVAVGLAPPSNWAKTWRAALMSTIQVSPETVHSPYQPENLDPPKL